MKQTIEWMVEIDMKQTNEWMVEIDMKQTNERIVVSWPHMTSTLSFIERQEASVLQALSAILPWCMVSHFNTRVFAQASLVQIWRCVREHHLGSATSTGSMIETVERFISGNK